MANKLVKITFPEISIICLLKYKLWCWVCDLNFPKSSKAKHPESWLFWTNLCFFLMVLAGELRCVLEVYQ